MSEHFEHRPPAGLGVSTRRTFLFTAALTAVVAGLGLDTRTATAQILQSSTALEFDPVKRVGELEIAMIFFQNEILQKLDLHVENPGIKQLIRSSFEAFNANLRNPMRAKQEAKDVSVTRPIGFSYCFDLDANSTAIMSFSQLTRQLHLSPDVDISDPGTMVFLSHEFAHVEQDNEYRKSVPWERYMGFALTDGGICLVPEDEAKAIAIQVEVANIVSGGALKTAVKNGQNNLPNMSRDPDLDKWLKKYVIAYYTRSEEDFVDFVKRHYSKVPGIKIFNTDLTPEE